MQRPFLPAGWLARGQTGTHGRHFRDILEWAALPDPAHGDWPVNVPLSSDGILRTGSLRRETLPSALPATVRRREEQGLPARGGPGRLNLAMPAFNTVALPTSGIPLRPFRVHADCPPLMMPPDLESVPTPAGRAAIEWAPAVPATK